MHLFLPADCDSPYLHKEGQGVTMYILFKSLLDPIAILTILALMALIFTQKSRTPGKHKFILMIPLLLIYCASISPVANSICYLAEKEYLDENLSKDKTIDIIVVLGGGLNKTGSVEGIMLSQQTSARVLKAVTEFNARSGKYLICSGRGRNSISEAEVMQRVAIGLGVPAAKIMLDALSDNTREHVVELNKLVRDKNTTIGLVTSAYHMRRSEKEFKKIFPNIVPLPSDYLFSSQSLSFYSILPLSENLVRFKIAFRELIGIGWYALRG